MTIKQPSMICIIALGLILIPDVSDAKCTCCKELNDYCCETKYEGTKDACCDSNGDIRNTKVHDWSKSQCPQNPDNSAGSTSENDFSHMKENEERFFRIDKSQARNCQLDAITGDPNIVYIKIKKTVKDPCHRYAMVDHDDDVYLNCYPGKIDFVKVEYSKAQGCGIAKMLTRLCLNADKIHNVKKGNKNMAFRKVGEFPWWDSTKSWVESKCKKLLYLHNRSNPKNRANLYIAEARLSGFTQMFISQVQDEKYWKRIYPPQGPCCIDEFEGYYDDEGNIVKDGVTVNVWNAIWFFCSPKDITITCCTVLEK